MRTVAYRHVVAASQTGPYSFGFSGTVKAAGGITAYSGVDTTNPVDVWATGATTTAGTAHTATSVTATDVNRTLVTIAGFATNTTATPPAGMTERIDQAAGTGAPTTAIETADVALTAAGATGAKTVTSATATTSATITVALRPIASGGSTTTLEAESATLVPGGAGGPTVETSWCPCSNNASVGNFSATNNSQYVQWSYTAPAAGSYQLKFRYSAGGGTATRKLTVNGTVIAANQSFEPPRHW